MSKQGSPAEAKKPPTASPGENHAPKPSLSQPATSKASTKLGCHSVSCKEKDVRFNFCNEHFRQFKFGLITKAGDKVLDYDKKFEHYQNWLKAQSNTRGNVA